MALRCMSLDIRDSCLFCNSLTALMYVLSGFKYLEMLDNLEVLDNSLKMFDGLNMLDNPKALTSFFETGWLIS